MGVLLGEFCEWYLELIKPRMRDEVLAPIARQVLAVGLDQVLRMLHPFVPFITERLWSYLNRQTPERGVTEELSASDLCVLAAWPRPCESWEDAALEEEFERVKRVISRLRELRSRHQVPPGKELPASIKASGELLALLERNAHLITFMARLSELRAGEDVDRPKNAASQVIGDMEIFLGDVLDPEKERARLETQMKKLGKQLEASSKKLANPKFVEKAPGQRFPEERAGGHRCVASREQAGEGSEPTDERPGSRPGRKAKSGISAGGDHVALDGDYLVDLHQTPEAPPEERTLVGTIARKDAFDNPVLTGNYNTINFNLKPVEFSEGYYTGSCPAMTDEECEEAAQGMVADEMAYTIRMQGTAACDDALVCGAEETVGFDILLCPVLDGNPDASGLAWYSCAWVGDGRPGLVTANGTGSIEMTFHSDHIFGDVEAGADLNDFALGFAPFAELAIADENCGPGEDRCVIATEEDLYEGWHDLRDTDPEMEHVYGMLIYSLSTIGHCGEGHCLH